MSKLAALVLAAAATLAAATAGAMGPDAAYRGALAHCADEGDHDACWQRVQGERATLAAALATEAKYTPAWAEGASEPELQGAHAEYIVAVAHALAVARSWRLPVGHATAALTEPLDALVAGELACRAAPKCLAAREAAKAEATFFGATVQPMCLAEQDREAAAASLARERANPSGVVSLSRLHELGAEQQAAQGRLAELVPEYTARRHHGWPGWRAECH